MVEPRSILGNCENNNKSKDSNHMAHELTEEARVVR